ncbi:F0F1 ATP synthase subunit delta [Timonella senegalensis]|uniref:F0F1 ATP synthase subunit delta n=1 Tax=Timonella senegalensis TaxID=1465825 RepID=UPI002FE10743
MRGTSQASLNAISDRFESDLQAAGQDALTIGEQLFVVVDALDSSGALRRSLADPSRSGEDKAALVRSVLSGGFDATTVSIMEAVAEAHWSSEADLVDAVSLLAINAHLVAAQMRGVLETVESELFIVTRALQGQREVRQALSDDSTEPSRRVKLLEQLLTGRADPVTVALATRATAKPRGERFVPALARVGDMAAARRSRKVAYVSTSHALSDAQINRLESLLTSAYGADMQLNVTVDPAVVGGLRIQVGSDVIDSTMLTRLADAKRRLAS